MTDKICAAHDQVTHRSGSCRGGLTGERMVCPGSVAMRRVGGSRPPSGAHAWPCAVTSHLCSGTRAPGGEGTLLGVLSQTGVFLSAQSPGVFVFP